MLLTNYEPAKEHIAAYIKFSAIVKKWMIDILLDDKSLFKVVLSTNLTLDM